MPGEGKDTNWTTFIVKQRCKNSVKNAHALPETDAYTNHNLVIMKRDLRLKTIGKRMMKKKQWNREVESDMGMSFYSHPYPTPKHFFPTPPHLSPSLPSLHQQFPFPSVPTLTKAQFTSKVSFCVIKHLGFDC